MYGAIDPYYALKDQQKSLGLKSKLAWTPYSEDSYYYVLLLVGTTLLCTTSSLSWS